MPNIHLSNRDRLVSALAGEIFGPNSRWEDSDSQLYLESQTLQTDQPIRFQSWDEYNKRYKSDRKGGEILKEEGPSKKYGLGILSPELERDQLLEQAEQPADTEVADEASIGLGEDEKLSPKQNKLKTDLLDRAEKIALLDKGNVDTGDSSVEHEDGESSLRLTHLSKPRAMGVSFILEFTEENHLLVDIHGGRYKSMEVTIGVDHKEGEETPVANIKSKEYQRTWWERYPLHHKLEVPSENLMSRRSKFNVDFPEVEGLETLNIQFEVLVRPLPKFYRSEYPENARLVTATLINRTLCKDPKLASQHSLYQSRFSVTTAKGNSILPYYESHLDTDSVEEKKMRLLYRDEKTFSVGHGCSGDWDCSERATKAETVHAEPLPVYQTPSVTPELRSSNGELLKVHLAPLAGLVEGDDGSESIEELLSEYEAWVRGVEERVKSLDAGLRSTAEAHTRDCRLGLSRMRKGMEIISEPGIAREAFRLTNRAMLLQQLSSTNKRVWDFCAKSHTQKKSEPYMPPDTSSKNAINRAWRPFQIAFILMNIESLVNGDAPDRETVELIWFPTGGGKTEAYLGAAAFSLFCRRLKDPRDTGTHILMRYTLRLLTSQQFQRAASLICAMEKIRQEEGMSEKLGEEPFSIGIWVGGDTTPNSLQDAKLKYNRAKKYGEDHYAMILLRCPWCGMEMGPHKKPNWRPERGKYLIFGVKKPDMQMHCPDNDCLFSSGLPVSVIDEELYSRRPSLVIGTVDKFASLAWRPDARSLFGIEDNGKRQTSPPGLIIQDELHLITGPLGSMVGLYETVVEKLCTDARNNSQPVKPKIISSTATTRASSRQILDLYARESAFIFPPSGIDSDDSFFARYDREKNGKRKPGRMYIGINPKNYTSPLTTQVRCFSVIMAATNLLEHDERKDPWWTLLLFFNSLRELGGGLTLFASDIPERLKHVQSQCNSGAKWRYLNDVFELTGRLSNSEVPRALEKLEREKKAQSYPVDACLASNIIEVGVDVDRLGLMGVIGQPKTTAQYIQATGRVGRKVGKPGLVLTLYNSSKPRDCSIYEQFRSYHSRLYARVEPASVTPFTLPVLERAVHAVLCAWIRQQLPLNEIQNPPPNPPEIFKQAAEALIQRMRKLEAPSEMEKNRMESALKDVLRTRSREWRQSEARVWSLPFNSGTNAEEQPLLRYAGDEAFPIKYWDKAWSTPNSMRGVDAESQPAISTLYSQDTRDENDDNWIDDL